jgi:hypothetical protein
MSVRWPVVLCASASSYLLAAVDGGVLANAVDLVLTKLDGVVRLGSVARHDCGFGGLFGLVVEWCVCDVRGCELMMMVKRNAALDLWVLCMEGHR